MKLNEADKDVLEALGIVWSAGDDLSIDAVTSSIGSRLGASQIEQALEIFAEWGWIDRDGSWLRLTEEGEDQWMRLRRPARFAEIAAYAVSSDNEGKTLGDIAAALKVPQCWVAVVFRQLERDGCTVYTPAMTAFRSTGTIMQVSASARRKYS